MRRGILWLLIGLTLFLGVSFIGVQLRSYFRFEAALKKLMGEETKVESFHLNYPKLILEGRKIHSRGKNSSQKFFLKQLHARLRTSSVSKGGVRIGRVRLDGLQFVLEAPYHKAFSDYFKPLEVFKKGQTNLINYEILELKVNSAEVHLKGFGKTSVVPIKEFEIRNLKGKSDPDLVWEAVLQQTFREVFHRIDGKIVFATQRALQNEVKSQTSILENSLREKVSELKDQLKGMLGN